MVAILGHLTRVIAGIQVPNSPLINASIALAHDNLPIQGYNHVMRTWLNGQAIINKLPPANRSLVDEEVFAMAAILHDLGWSEDPKFSSPGKRFEVDGANAARSFLQHHGGRRWNAHRQRIVWDAIALHAVTSIAQYKEIEVKLLPAAVLAEFAGPDAAKAQFGDFITVTQDEWERVSKEFPRTGFGEFLNFTNIRFCRQKPETTYDNAVGDWGEKYVADYTRVGHRSIDVVESITWE